MSTVELRKLVDADNGSHEKEVRQRHPENFIGRPLFYAEYTGEVREEVLASQRLATLIRTLAIRERDKLLISQPERVPSIEDIEKQLKKRARSIVENLITNMHSQRWLSAMAFMISNVLGRMYHQVGKERKAKTRPWSADEVLQGIHLRETEVAELKKWALFAEKNKLSILFLPCHKSHIDYLVLSYLFYRLNISLPAIAAGDNLDIPLVGPILKKLGAWWIKRGNWSADPLYVGIIREYVENLLNNGQNIEFFIEGTRSRTGKLLNPRFGILKIILEAVISGSVKDCVVLPISIGYDKVIVAVDGTCGHLYAADTSHNFPIRLSRPGRTLKNFWARRRKRNR